jgi:D-glycero-D-manno-heptose 1,7-bisphosphate phosphatase
VSERAEPRPAVFLDRDGTLIDQFGYLADPAGVLLLPGVAPSLSRLRAQKIPLVLITNQSGVARGLIQPNELEAVHQELQRQLAAEAAQLDAIYHCPHHPEHGQAPYRLRCACRKPEPGMYLQAARDLNLQLASSVAIGDTGRDLEAAQRAGIPTRILVLSGKGQATHDAWQANATKHPATHIFRDLDQALETIQSSLG